MSKSIGIIGGGQLGMMLIEGATNYNVTCHTLDPNPQSSASSIAESHTVGDLNDYETVLNFGLDKDVVTAELEAINVDALEALQAKGVQVFPQPHVYRTVQDKGLQKQFFKENNIPTAPFFLTQQVPDEVDLPCVQKLRVGGYDGRGVQLLKDPSDLDNAFRDPSVVEELVDIEKEISVIVARDTKGHIATYDPSEMVVNQKGNLLDTLIYPARISTELGNTAKSIAMTVIESLDMVGVLAVEFFVSKNGDVWVNEVAPRPHNSGHQTIEASKTSQYEQLIRILNGVRLASTETISPAVMINILGEPGHDGGAVITGDESVFELPGVYPHFYGKLKTKPLRKMGHVTILREDLNDALSIAREIAEKVKVIT